MVFRYCAYRSVFTFALQRYKLFFIYANEKWLILTNSTFCVLGFLSLFYVLRFSSEWGLFGRNTRSAIRGTSSSFVRPWFILGFLYEGDRQDTAGGNLNKRTLILRESVQNSAFIVRVLSVYCA